MEYFIIKQDKRYTNPPTINDLHSLLRRKELNRKDEHKIPQRNIVYANSDNYLDFLDILDDQLFLVTDKVKKVISLYEPSAIFKTFCILNNRKNEYGLYYAPILPEIDCITEARGIGCKKNIALDREKIGLHCFFRALGSDKETTVVRLDVAESLLRRDVRGMKLEKINS